MRPTRRKKRRGGGGVEKRREKLLSRFSKPIYLLASRSFRFDSLTLDNSHRDPSKSCLKNLSLFDLSNMFKSCFFLKQLPFRKKSFRDKKKDTGKKRKGENSEIPREEDLTNISLYYGIIGEIKKRRRKFGVIKMARNARERREGEKLNGGPLSPSPVFISPECLNVRIREWNRRKILGIHRVFIFHPSGSDLCSKNP